MLYHPPRQKTPRPPRAPLEIDLVFNVRPCGTCSFFWPDDTSQQPYGPYPAFDFSTNTPAEAPPGPAPYPWLLEKTSPQAFPNPEIMDGCRKAPIMTIGINPNLTAFAPGQVGASWAYPSFYSDNGTDEWTKFAYYYRYRSVYQERFDLDFIRQFLLPERRFVAPRAGIVVAAPRPTDSPSFDVQVRYDGDAENTTVSLQGELGAPRWVLLYDPHQPNNRFDAGDTVAAQLEVPAGQATQVYRDEVGYYEQFVPVLSGFDTFLRSHGYSGAPLRMGEDVCQLDMVACASPHWNPDFLGGTKESEQTIIDNCVIRNAWAMKQLVHTQPAVLYIVGESSYDMFYKSFGALIVRDTPLSTEPADGAFTLLRESTDPNHPVYFQFSTTIDGTAYNLRTRLVVTPHFSYNINFQTQFRLNPEQWQNIQAQDPTCAQFLKSDPQLTYVPAIKATDYTAFMVSGDVQSILATIDKDYPNSAAALRTGFYDAHQMMGNVLADLYTAGQLGYGPAAGATAGAVAGATAGAAAGAAAGSAAGSAGAAPGVVLRRNEGACHFCVNQYWQFPLGCPYGKINETPPPPGFLERVTAAIVSAGKPRSATGTGGAL